MPQDFIELKVYRRVELDSDGFYVTQLEDPQLVNISPKRTTIHKDLLKDITTGVIKKADGSSHSGIILHYKDGRIQGAAMNMNLNILDIDHLKNHLGWPPPSEEKEAFRQATTTSHLSPAGQIIQEGRRAKGIAAQTLRGQKLSR